MIISGNVAKSDLAKCFPAQLRMNYGSAESDAAIAWRRTLAHRSFLPPIKEHDWWKIRFQHAVHPTYDDYPTAYNLRGMLDTSTAEIEKG